MKISRIHDIGIPLVAVAFAVFATGYILFKAGWDAPPVTTTQNGFRGTAMVQVFDQEDRARLAERSQPAAPLSEAAATGPRARETYPSLQVLGDISEEQFNRLMLQFAEWVAPKEGENASCAYCHNLENMADRSKYTHAVATRMIQMNRTINAEWTSHVGTIGVTCYTCHRGQPVPANIWFKETGPREGNGLAWVGWRNGQNIAARSAGLTSLPYDHMSEFLENVRGSGNIRVTPTSALPTRGQNPPGGIMGAEKTYGLMVHMSEALGVNCTFCHNSRAFNEWNEGPTQRVTAWHGIRMVRELNQTYLNPLRTTYPTNRLGPTGDAPKANCATCHNGQQEPLNGVSMLKDYMDELGGRRR